MAPVQPWLEAGELLALVNHNSYKSLPDGLQKGIDFFGRKEWRILGAELYIHTYPSICLSSDAKYQVSVAPNVILGLGSKWIPDRINLQ